MAFHKTTEGFPTEGAENTEAKAPVTADTKLDLASKGQQIISNMSPEEKAAIGSKSDTLIFEGLLGTQKIQQAKTGKGRVRTNSFKPVGLKLRVTEDTSVPQIPVTRTRARDGVDQSEISYITVQAGEIVTLSLFEFMYLVSRPEYSGYVTVNGNPKGGCLGILSNKFKNGEDKLPTPSFKYTEGGTPKDSMAPIDQKNADGAWEPLPEYAEKFGALYVSNKKKSSTRAAKVDNSAAVTAALRDILGI